MKATCGRIQEILTTNGPRALQDDPEAQSHLAECEECFAVLEAQTALDDALASLPEVDAPDLAVEKLLQSITSLSHLEEASEAPKKQRARPTPSPEGAASWRRYRRVLATAAVLVLAILLGRTVWQRGAAPESMELGSSMTRSSKAQSSKTSISELRFDPPEEPLSQETLDKLEALGYLGGGGETGPSQGAAKMSGDAGRELPIAEDRLQEEGWLQKEDRQLLHGPEPKEKRSRRPPPDRAPDPEPEFLMKKTEENEALPLGGLPQAPPSPPPPEGFVAEYAGGGSTVVGGKDDRFDAPSGESPALLGQRDNLRSPAQPSEGLADVVFDQDAGGFQEPTGSLDERRKSPEAVSESRQRAQDFLEELETLEDLAFQDANGYWANTYLPGDPLYRQLSRRLLGLDGVDLPPSSEPSLRIHEEVRNAAQPFDPPQGAALAVYIHGSRRSLEDSRRMLVQVGLQATSRRSGQRPPLNLALILDLTEPPTPADAAALRALVLELAEERTLGDHFHLLAAGPEAALPGGLVVGPRDFRHGPLRVALDQLFAVSGSATPPRSLEETLPAAVRAVSSGAEEAPLGSSAVVIATTRTLGKATSSVLARLARSSAIGGVPVSTWGVGGAVDRGELDLIALEGQGGRRWMATATEASSLVQRELASASRAVARALRLRIRLAPGVKLVDVLGSRRLTAYQAESVREAERSIDQHLARALGIEADRGEDEDGLQIVIPAFFSGDAHVILLDVVVPGPGPIADVTVRYKDLVALGNGVARDQLSLPRGRRAPGPLELNVLKNRLAYRLYGALEAAGNLVEQGNEAAARKNLTDLASLLDGLRRKIPGLAQDRDLAADLSVLHRYVERIGASEDSSPPTQRELIDSLRLAARLKILPPPKGAEP